MKKKKLSLAILGCLVILLGIGGVALASSKLRSGTTAALAKEPNFYGACVNQKTGYIRLLERTNPAKSYWGACKQDGSERYVSLVSAVGLNGSMSKVASQVESVAQKVNAAIPSRFTLLNGDDKMVCKPRKKNASEFVCRVPKAKRGTTGNDNQGNQGNQGNQDNRDNRDDSGNEQQSGS